MADIRKIYRAISVEEARMLKNDFLSRNNENPKLQKAIEILQLQSL
jgi:putative transposase